MSREPPIELSNMTFNPQPTQKLLSTMLIFFCACVSAGGSTSVDSPVQLDRCFSDGGRSNLSFAAPATIESCAHFALAGGGSTALDNLTDVNNCPVNTDCVRIRKLFANGTLDSAGFNAPPTINFMRFQPLFGASVSSLSGAALDSQNRVVVVGATLISGADTQFRAVRLLPNGLPDSSFSGDDTVNIDFDSGSFPGGADIANAVAIDEQDRIVVAGRTQISSTDFDFAVARLKSDGTLDASFFD